MIRQYSEWNHTHVKSKKKVPYTIFIYMSVMMDTQYAYHTFSVDLLNSEKQLCGQNIFRSKNKQKTVTLSW